MSEKDQYSEIMQEYMEAQEEAQIEAEEVDTAAEEAEEAESTDDAQDADAAEEAEEAESTDDAQDAQKQSEDSQDAQDIPQDDVVRYKRIARRIEKELKQERARARELEARLKTAEEKGFVQQQTDPTELISRVREGDPDAIADALQMLLQPQTAQKQIDDSPESLPFDHPFHDIKEWADEQPEKFQKAIELEQEIIKQNPRITNDDLYRRIYELVETGGRKPVKNIEVSKPKMVSLANKPSSPHKTGGIKNRLDELSGNDLVREWANLSPSQRAELMRSL